MKEISPNSHLKLFLFLMLLALPLFADYSDVLLVANSNHSDGAQIADYFAAQRNITHWLNLSLPNDTDGMKFDQLNASVLQPIKAWLQENGTGSIRGRRKLGRNL